MVLLWSADVVWMSLKNRLSRGTWGISYPWSATSSLAVFWQVSPCSRPESGSSEAHENKQYIKTLLSTYTKFQKTRNYSAILVFILMNVPIFSFPNTLLGDTPTKTPFPAAYFKYRKKLHRLSLFCKNLQELSWPRLCHPQIFLKYILSSMLFLGIDTILSINMTLKKKSHQLTDHSWTNCKPIYEVLHSKNVLGIEDPPHHQPHFPPPSGVRRTVLPSCSLLN